ncbi:MAG: hypothetical protein WCA35_28765 [Kovacikia sp.]
MLPTSSEDDHSSHLANLQVSPKSTANEDVNPRSDASTPPSPGPRRGELQKNWGLLRKLHRATLIARQQHFPEGLASELSSKPEALKALQEVARRGEIQKAQANWQRRGSSLTSAKLEPLDSYAAPLAPLRERDIKALAAWFERDDMDLIATNITCRLLQFMPEPCWEDDPLDFLKEFP